ncbi:MAG TPA: hypothetical protein VFJ05_05770 [Nitrososphaeraceae archaeon]|nr:hypothetical protein [Nitrososphaeraceae archaeon]
MLFYYRPPSISKGDLTVALEADCGLLVIIFPDGLDNEGNDCGRGELAVKLG